MNGGKWVRCVLSMALASALSFCSLACLITGFDITQANWFSLALWCWLCPVAFALCFRFKGQFAVAAALFAGVFLWLMGVVDGAQALLYRVTEVYSQFLQCPVMGEEGSGITWALCAWASVIAMAVCFSISCRRAAWLPALLALMPVGVCIPVRNGAPGGIWLSVLLVGIGVMMLLQNQRRWNGKQTIRVALVGFVPVLLMTAALFWAQPREKFQQGNTPERMLESVAQWLGLYGAHAGPVQTGGGAVDLRQLGSREESYNLVMTVTSQKGGRIYLRSCAYDTYYNSTWTNLMVPDYLGWPEQQILEPTDSVVIQTQYPLDLQVFPYYPAGDRLDTVIRGISNYSRQTTYQYDVMCLPHGYQALENPEKVSTDFTQLPGVSAIWAKKKLPEILGNAQTTTQKAAAISRYVSGAARYDLQVRAMEETRGEFVQWFLEESREGYCVHFATAATVLLRAAGIPARYVTGYVVNARAGEPTAVYGKNAHAWTEYWLPGVGWVMLESTPASSVERTEEEAFLYTTAAFFRDPKTLMWLGCAAGSLPVLGVILLAVQWALRLHSRNKKRRKGSCKDRVLYGWQEITLLCRLLEQLPREDLFALAQEARFSSHVIKEQAAEKFDRERKDLILQHKQLPLGKKLLHRLRWGIY